jgi:hypothetical protein
MRLSVAVKSYLAVASSCETFFERRLNVKSFFLQGLVTVPSQSSASRIYCQQIADQQQRASMAGFRRIWAVPVYLLECQSPVRSSRGFSRVCG